MHCIDQQIEQVCVAESLGFADVWLTEHYFTGESVYNDALLFASALTQCTTRIRIGFAVIQMPFHHPIRLAVQLALLDNLSKGRKGRSTTITSSSVTACAATTIAPA